MHFTEKGDKQKELLKECIKLADDIKDLIPRDLNEIKIIQYVLSLNLFENEELVEVLGEINMEYDLEKLGIAAYTTKTKKNRVL